MSSELFPFDLRWSEADPRTHPFDHASASAEVIALPPAADVPVPPAGADVWAHIAWAREVGNAWTQGMTRALVGRFGRWSTGWQWSRPGMGGPVDSWCCPKHSITTPEETLERVANALCEWRRWLEELAELFEHHPVGATDREHAWERAAVLLITRVLDRTRADETWYVHCELVLTWYLTRWDVPQDTAEEWVDRAVDGRFESWIAPGNPVVREVAERLAGSPWEEESQ
ncbi:MULTISPECIES: hypothetical protein [unclassified Nocardiopsis]|uniref:hypothetical protein n=1 Tax=unclassified Nocardiopsis TaxID=2649073 RepID=UPI001161165C|nr:hypothetical protein [Nocardiopsis sp. TSRI0078]